MICRATRRISFMLLVLRMALLFMVYLLAAVPVTQAAATGTCNELQIIFIVDQSGSMGGCKTGSCASPPQGHPDPNDPLELRFFGPEHGIETLGPLRYQAYPNTTIQVGIIHFGDRPELGLPWTVIKPVNGGEWKQQLTALNSDLAPGYWSTHNLGNTNFLRAFQAANSMFNQQPAQVGSCPSRGIVLLTDGRPSLPIAGFSMDSHMKDVEDYVRRYFPSPNYRLYVIGMNDSQDNYWPDTEPYWQKIAGDPSRVGLVKTQDEVGKRIQSIALELLGPGDWEKHPVCPGSLTVPPYLQSVAFTLYKSSSQPDHLRVEDPIGLVEQNRSDIQVSVDGFDTPIETVRIERPIPGKWKLQPTLPRVSCDINMLSIPATGQWLTPSVADTPVQYTNVNLSFRLGDASGNPLPRYGAPYEITIGSNLLDPKRTLPLNLTATAGGVYSTTVVPQESGTHSVTVRAISQDADGKLITVYDRTIGAFEVAPAQLAMLEGPAVGVSYPQHVPISLTLTMLDPVNRPIRLAVPLTVTASVTESEQTKPVQIMPTVDGTLRGTILPEQAGAHQLIYQAFVNVNGTPKNAGGGNIAFEVFKTHLLTPRLINPVQGSFEATDLLGKTTGLILELELVDENNQRVAASQVLEAGENSMKVFELRVTDSKNYDRSKEIPLQQGAQEGRYRAEGRTFGPDNYNIDVLPIAKLKRDYVWGARSWSFPVSGSYNPLSFFLLAIIGLVVIDLVQCAARKLLVRSHPCFPATIVIMPPKEKSDRAAFKKTLPRLNKVVYANGWGWSCLFIPVLHRDLSLVPFVRRIRIKCPDQKHIKDCELDVEVWMKKGTKRQFTLRCNGEGSSRELEYGYYLYCTANQLR